MSKTGKKKRKKKHDPSKDKPNETMETISSIFASNKYICRPPSIVFPYHPEFGVNRTPLSLPASNMESAKMGPGCGTTSEQTKMAFKSLALRISARNSRRSIPRQYFSLLEDDSDLVETLPSKYTFHIANNCHEYNCVRNAFLRAGVKRRNNASAATFYWGRTLSEDEFKCLQPPQVVNHFPGTWQIGRKDALGRLLNGRGRKYGAEYDFHPKTITISSKSDQKKFKATLEYGPKSIWIVKPKSSSCGRGIKLIQGVSDFKNSVPKNCVAQEYLSKPYLIDGRKFDLRMYVLVTSYDPLRIYIYQNGLTRFATEKYSTKSKSLKNVCVHLTNYSVNKKSDAFEFNTAADEDGVGNKWSFKALVRYLNEKGEDVEKMKQNIYDVIRKTIIANEPNVVTLCNRFFGTKYASGRSPCFENFGFDIFLDRNLKAHLIEVNVSPSLSSGSPLDRQIKNALISDVFHVVGLRSIYKRCQSLQHNVRRSCAALNDSSVEDFSCNDLDLITQMEDEFCRAATTDFLPIFPANSKKERDAYSRFFAYQRYNNTLIRKWLDFKQKVKAKGSAIPRSVREPSSVLERKILVNKPLPNDLGSSLYQISSREQMESESDSRSLHRKSNYVSPQMYSPSLAETQIISLSKSSQRALRSYKSYGRFEKKGNLLQSKRSNTLSIGGYNTLFRPKKERVSFLKKVKNRKSITNSLLYHARPGLTEHSF